VDLEFSGRADTPLVVVAGVEVPPSGAPQLPRPASSAQIAEFVALRAGGCVGADYANLALADADGTAVRVFHSEFLSTEMQQRYVRIPIDAPYPIVTAIRAGQTITLEGEADYRDRFPQIWDDTVRAGVEATVSIPLIRGDGSPIGAIGFAWVSSPSFEVKLDTALHSVAALVTEIIERAERYDAEHEMIAELHRRLISGIPEVAGLGTAARYRPAGRISAVGGDWYEGLVVDDGVLAVVIGDVVGHGLAAAADMALIRGMITALIHDGVAIDDVFVRVSRVLQRRPEDVLATAALVIIDVHRDSLTYSTAGHPPPLVVQPDGSTVILDQANAPMLGVHASRAAAHTVPFPPGARLVMYTDGLVERRDRPFTEGIDEVIEFLTNQSTRLGRTECIDLLVERVAGADADHDDIAIVIIDRT